MVPVLIKIPMANKMPPSTNNNVANPMALQGTNLLLISCKITS
jgi:hypothetical protein